MSEANIKCSREELREAAVWMTLLRGPDRSEKLERGFNRWLAARPQHAVAFGKISSAWELTGALPRGPFPRLTRWQRAGFRQGFLRAAVAVAALAAIALTTLLIQQRAAGIGTDIGEQRMLALDDGTRVFLNTDTRVLVKYSDRRREVQLKEGEALFEVAKQRVSWPFVVTVAGRQITALGTSFVVRRKDSRVSVMLVEGRVAVLPAPAEAAVTLNPGERLTLDAGQPPHRDEPALEKVIAWRAGQVDLDGLPLADAVAEMNRYSKQRLVVERPEAAAIAITGIFRAGDSANFASAVAQAYGLDAHEEGGTIELRGLPNHKPLSAARSSQPN